MRLLRPLSCALAGALAALPAAGCGDRTGPRGGGGDSPTGAVTRRIEPGGGTLTAVAEDGARFTLSIPAGAVRDAAEVTLRPLPAGAGSRAEVALEPAGMVFRKPFTLSVTLPAGAGPEAVLALAAPDGPIPLPTTTPGDGRTLTTSLAFFGFSESGTLPGGGAFAPGSGGRSDGNTVAATSLSCPQLAAAGRSAFDRFVAEGQHRDAVAAALASDAALQKAGCTDTDGLAAEAGAVACERLGATIQRIRTTAISAHGEFQRNITEVLDWFALSQTLSGLECGAQGDVPTATEEEVGDFLGFFAGRLGALAGTDFEAYQNLREEARDIEVLMANVLQLGLPDAALELEAGAFVPTVEAMRSAAYRMCRDWRWHYPMSRLMPDGFYAGRDIIGVPAPRPGPIWPAPKEYAGVTAPRIADELQYCATDLTLEALDAEGAVTATGRAGTDGAPGSWTPTATLEVPADGTLRIAGELAGFTCLDGNPADLEVTVLFEGVPVRTLSRTGGEGYLDGGPLELDLAGISELAGVDPDPGAQYELVLRRRRTACNPVLWGPEDFDVLTATLGTGGVLMAWTFDDGLDGWIPGTGSGGTVAAADGKVALRGYGEPYDPNAWISRTIDLPATAGTLRLSAGGECGGFEPTRDTRLRVQVFAEGAVQTLLNWTTVAGEGAMQRLSTSLAQYAGRTVDLHIQMDDEGEQEDSDDDPETLCVDDVEILP